MCQVSGGGPPEGAPKGFAPPAYSVAGVANPVFFRDGRLSMSAPLTTASIFDCTTATSWCGPGRDVSPRGGAVPLLLRAFPIAVAKHDLGLSSPAAWWNPPGLQPFKHVCIPGKAPSIVTRSTHNRQLAPGPSAVGVAGVVRGQARRQALRFGVVAHAVRQRHLRAHQLLLPHRLGLVGGVQLAVGRLQPLALLLRPLRRQLGLQLRLVLECGPLLGLQGGRDGALGAEQGAGSGACLEGRLCCASPALVTRSSTISSQDDWERHTSLTALKEWSG